jgi:hypothetical protein
MNKVFDLKTLIAVASIILTIVIFFISKKIKELSFKNVAITELVAGENLKDESIKVYFDDVRIFNLYSISCLLSNSGNQPITKSDFVDGFEIQFPDSLKILKCSFKTYPENIKITDITNNKSSISVLPDLLNPNDKVELSFYVSSPRKDLLPHSPSRIIGGEVLNLKMNEEIRAKTEFSNRVFAGFEGPIFWIAFIYTILYILILFYSSYFQQDSIKSPLGKFIFFLLLCIGLICNLFYLIQSRF